MKMTPFMVFCLFLFLTLLVGGQQNIFINQHGPILGWQFCQALGTMCIYVCLSVCRLSVTHVLWLNGTSQGVGDNTVGQGDNEYSQAVNSNHVSICSSLTAILNVKFLLAAITHVRRTPYRILALIVAFDIAASPQRVWDCSHLWAIAFSLGPKVGCWPSGRGGTVGRPSLQRHHGFLFSFMRIK